MSEDKTEAASPRRRKKAREEGQVARSAELVSCAGLLVLMYAGPSFAPSLSRQVTEYCSRMVGEAAGAGKMTPAHLVSLVGGCFTMVGGILGPLMIMTVVCALATNIFQVGFFFNPKQLGPKWSHLNPAEGLKRLVQPRSLVELAKSIAKVSVVGWSGWDYLHRHSESLYMLLGMPAAQVAPKVGGFAYQMAMQMITVLTVLAALDYAYQRWNFERGLKMTKQEVKDEYRDSEGNPEIKNRIRQRQRETSRRRMMADVPTATVIVTNPTHFAVALRYEMGQSGAPKVVAKGQDLIALRIRELAVQNGVPIVENVPLARALHKSVEVGREIPSELFRAVAEILAYVWRLERAGARREQS